MNEKPSRTFPVFICSSVCLFLMCVISALALHANNMNAQLLRRLAEQGEALALTDRAIHEFDAARLAVLRYRETSNPALEKLVAEHVDQAMKYLDEAKSRFIMGANHKVVDELADLFKSFENFFHEEFALSRKAQDTQEAKVKTDASAAEAEMHSEELSARQSDFLNKFEMEARMVNQQTTVLLLVATSVALLTGIVVSFAVARKINRESPTANGDGFSNPSPSGDLQVVADKLQEVVNLLRK